MMGAALQSLRWSLSLGAKIGRVVPWLTGVVVLLALVSQVAMLLASFLPLKVVILLGSESMPRYLPEELKVHGKDALIAAFSLVTVGFFIVHLIAERFVINVTGQATRKLLKKSHKLVLFENQDDMAANAYQRFSRALAGGVFACLALTGLAVFYAEMAIVIIGYFIGCVALLWAGAVFNKNVRERLESNLSSTLNLLAGVGFFVSFGFLVLDFIVLTPPGVIVAIISLLASRMILQKINTGIMDVSAISKQRPKLEALFFHGKVFQPELGSKDRGIWHMIRPEVRESWLEPVFEEFVVSWAGIRSIEWHQSAVPNVPALSVVGNNEQRYLVKLFDRNRSSLALHEATLLGEAWDGLPAPKLVANTRVRQLHCLIYEIVAGYHPDRGAMKQLTESVRGRLLSVSLPHGLQLQYSRSKPMLWQRLDETIVDRLLSCANSDRQRDLVNELGEKVADLREQLRRLPLSLINPEISSSSILVTSSDIQMLNWGRWSIDPVGAGWRVGPKQLNQLADYLDQAAEHRPDLRKVSTEAAELAALTYSFEAKSMRQQFEEAFELLPAILKRLDHVEGESLLFREGMSE